MQPLRLSRGVWLACALCLGLTLVQWKSRALATQVAKVDFDHLCDRADAICQVMCVESHSEWDQDRTTIYTTTTLRILQPVKGSSGSREITLRLPGGTVNDTTLTIPGFPLFTPGDEMVIFLTGRDRSGYPWPMGMTQGIYPVSRDDQGRAKVVVRASLRPPALTKPAPGGGSNPQAVPLDDFLGLIRQRLQPTSPDSTGSEPGVD